MTGRIRARSYLFLLGPSLLVLSGCGQQQDSLHPESHQSRDIASLFWWMTGGAWLGLALVVALLVVAWRRGGRRGPGDDAGGDKPGERAAWYVVVGAGVVMPIAVISALFVVSDLFVVRTTDAPAQAVTRLTVVVVGHQWWWEIRYPASGAVTANELHIPVRTPVRIEARTADVIHSLWVPELNRKIDTIPGETNAIEFDADAVGVYRGQCAEFCGLQHANMGIAVYVDTPSAFRAWLAREAKPAAVPAGAAGNRGRAIFLSGSCAACHAIRGTEASGTVGPDLTHFASRHTLAALTAPNGPREVSDWIRHAQDIKPGNQMPNIDLPSSQLKDVVAYLEGLR